MAAERDDWQGVTDLTVSLGAVVTAVSVGQAMWAGEPRFLLGTALGAAWVALAITGWGRPR